MGYTRDDYTVAWICALPLEMTAAKLMLDKVHPSLPKLNADHNTYTLGSVGGHNVVLACLPSGVYGTTAAAVVLAHMLQTYPSLRFALVVGIGGGVPSKTANIRLGDVVVSMPTNASGGVVQYDYGKTLRNGNLQRTGSLNKPPQYLLTAVSQVRSETEISLEKVVTEMLQKQGGIQKQFSRPSKDLLSEATYDHKSEDSDCSACGRTQIVNRKPRESGEPLIHYGLIASGNQVMKNAQIRDLIAQPTGVLCFEMEAAGLMDQISCLVIRGICDYCDSHKHKDWQGYAALTAAAYAAHLLQTVPVTENISPRAQKVEFTEEQRACLRSLFITDPTEDKNSLKRRKGDRAFGTCSWIFETEELRHWLGLSTYECQEERNILWLYGNPGTGKSTMAITLSEELPSKSNFHDGSKTLAYFFCDSSSDVNRTAIAVLRGLLYQLVKQNPPLMHHLLPRYNERKDKLFGSFDALWTVLLDIAKSSDGMEFYYIIDALDECEPDSQKSLLEQIHQTFSSLNSKGSAPSNMHVLITSRPYHEIRRSLSIFRSKDLATYEAVASDLRKVIKEKVEVLSKRNRYPKALIADVSRVLKEKAEGTFLWVGIACDELAQVQSRNALKTLQALPRGLNSLYQKLLDTAITTSGEEDKTMILEMLSFVAFALRPLTLAELSGACQLYPDEEEDCRLQFTQEIIDSCRLMIVVQDEHVRLLHKSVKDFLSRETQNIDSLQVNARMAYRLSKTKFTVIREHESFFSLNSGSWNKWMRLYNILKAFPYTRLDVGFSTLHAAARWGIPELIRFALNETNAGFQESEPTGEEEIYVDSDYTTFKGVTPLAEAAKSGQMSILKILLERGPRHQQINQDVIKAAAGNIMNGDKVMAFHLDQYENQIQITNDMIKVVSQNRSYGKLIIGLLLERCKDQIQYNTQIASTVIENFDVLVVTFLLKQCEGQFQINESIIEAAAQNYSHGNEIMTLMLERYKDQVRDNPHLCGNRIQLSDDIFRAAARNYRHENVMFLLFDRYGEEILITTETIRSGIPIIGKVEYNRTGSYLEYTAFLWKKYTESTGASAVKAFQGYWRSVNREAGERYWNVPIRRSQNFGTQDLITKIEGLIMQHTVPTRIAICGMPGIGKTQIALELAYRVREYDPKYSIFWISSFRAEDIERSYLNIASMLGFYDVEREEAKGSVRHYLSQEHAGKYLLIFDDAEDFSQLEEYLPQNEEAQILVTTRNKNLASTIASTDVIMLDPPTSEAILEFLENSLVDKSLLDN
ncbi:hypothetical protein TCE0_041f13896 [Talaromyces pinophilus]|uniref:NACHT domain-containing protein n=1 Tax=Talaromyces pinophilus TaxID=128442 RepID=A0A6V8HNA2_TALPI|nr:hypothetical protein TCE0_041f13896 [Talaromyces pinophilus]